MPAKRNYRFYKRRSRQHVRRAYKKYYSDRLRGRLFEEEATVPEDGEGGGGLNRLLSVYVLLALMAGLALSMRPIISKMSAGEVWRVVAERAESAGSLEIDLPDSMLGGFFERLSGVDLKSPKRVLNSQIWMLDEDEEGGAKNTDAGSGKSESGEGSLPSRGSVISNMGANNPSAGIHGFSSDMENSSEADSMESDPSESEPSKSDPGDPSAGAGITEPSGEPEPTPEEIGQYRLVLPDVGSPETVVWGEEPEVAIYHSHTSESYEASQGASYLWGSMEGVVSVGEELAKALKEKHGISVVQSRKIHDYPVWREAYSNSEKTVKELLQKYPTIKFVFDIHRDAVKSGSQDGSIVSLNGRRAARVFIVVCTDKLGLPHPNWRENLSFAYRLYNKFEEIYPGLCRGVNVRDDLRLNQHLHKRSLLLEIGGNGNTKEEALNSVGMVADVIAELLKEYR